MNPEILIQLLAVLISAFIVLKGIREYKEAQRWKKLEFVSKEIKEFFNDAEIKRALQMLDWNACSVPLNPGEIGDETKFSCSDEKILDALRTHDQKSRFTPEEVVIKKIFDNFLDKLTMFENYIETGLINAKDIQPYLEYWIKILADPKNDRKDKKVRDQIWKYIDQYGYKKVRSLCHRKEFI